jgi:hypothetical protein
MGALGSIGLGAASLYKSGLIPGFGGAAVTPGATGAATLSSGYAAEGLGYAGLGQAGLTGAGEVMGGIGAGEATALAGMTEGGVGVAGATPGLSLSGLAGPAAAGVVGSMGGGAVGTWLEKEFNPPGGQQEWEAGGQIAGGAAAGAAVGSVVPGIGTAIGAVVGAVVGAIQAVTDDTVICSELYRQGLLPNHVRASDALYGAQIDREAYHGYMMLFSPVAKRMRTSRVLTEIVKPFGLATAYEMASRVNPDIKGTLLGKVILKVGIPLCRWVYRLTRTVEMEVI